MCACIYQQTHFEVCQCFVCSLSSSKATATVSPLPICRSIWSPVCLWHSVHSRLPWEESLPPRIQDEFTAAMAGNHSSWPECNGLHCGSSTLVCAWLAFHWPDSIMEHITPVRGESLLVSRGHFSRVLMLFLHHTLVSGNLSQALTSGMDLYSHTQFNYNNRQFSQWSVSPCMVWIMDAILQDVLDIAFEEKKPSQTQ